MKLYCFYRSRAHVCCTMMIAVLKQEVVYSVPYYVCIFAPVLINIKPLY